MVKIFRKVFMVEVMVDLYIVLDYVRYKLGEFLFGWIIGV